MLHAGHQMQAAPILGAPIVDPDTAQFSAAPELLASLASLAAVIQAERDEEVVYQGDPAEYCFEVVSGCLRTVRLLEDGRRHVGEFLFAGDVFGCETAGEHEFGVEAVTPATLRRYRASAIEARADSDLVFAQRLRRHSACQMRAARGRLLMLGRKTASERIASFLLEMQHRVLPSAQGTVALPMCRSDVADYLGLTVETVCRGLTDLRHDGIIGVARGCITVRDRGALTRAGSDQIH